jgi:hypothetical protein
MQAVSKFAGYHEAKKKEEKGRHRYYRFNKIKAQEAGKGL